MANGGINVQDMSQDLQLYNREWHEKTCSDDPNLPYKCQQCGKKLKSKDAMKKHKKIHKTHSLRLFYFS